MKAVWMSLLIFALPATAFATSLDQEELPVIHAKQSVEQSSDVAKTDCAKSVASSYTKRRAASSIKRANEARPCAHKHGRVYSSDDVRQTGQHTTAAVLEHLRL